MYQPYPQLKEKDLEPDPELTKRGLEGPPKVKTGRLPVETKRGDPKSNASGP